jgi:hypothetical protein
VCIPYVSWTVGNLYMATTYQTAWCRAFFEEAVDFFPGKEIPDFHETE